MSQTYRLSIAVGLAVVLIVGVAVGVALYTSHGGSTGHPQGTSEVFAGASYPPGVHAPDFTLTDQQGRRVSLSSYHGLVVVLAFLSSDPGCRACVLVAQQIRGALDELEKAPGVRTLLVSTDPRSDSPTRVRHLLEATSLMGRVEYLTGAAAQLRGVWRDYRIIPASARRKASEMSTTVLLIDRHGEERVGFGLEQITPESLSHDIRRLESG